MCLRNLCLSVRPVLHGHPDWALHSELIELLDDNSADPRALLTTLLGPPLREHVPENDMAGDLSLEHVIDEPRARAPSGPPKAQNVVHQFLRVPKAVLT